MNSTDNYIIEKVVVEVQTTNMETANYVKNNISSFLQENVFPQLEVLLDDYKNSDKTMRIDSLLLNIVPAVGFNLDDIGAKIIHQFSLELNKKVELSRMEEGNEFTTNGVDVLSIQQKQKEMFLFFLENGYLPWSGKKEDIVMLVQFDSWLKALDDTVFTSTLFTLLNQNKIAFDRFLVQFTPEVIFSFLFSASSDKSFPATTKQLADSIKRVISNRNKERIIEFHDKLIGFLQKNNLFLVDVKRELLEVTAEAFEKGLETSYLKKSTSGVIDSLSEKDSKQFEDEPFFETRKNEIAIQNAGLILLHPFLKRFFEKLGILDEKGGIKKSDLQVAVQSLHYMATGTEEFFEANLVFEKFLCGVPLKMPIERDSLLTDMIKDESQLLLTEVVKHWPALKNTSPEGLRQLFIQHNGKLVQEKSNYKLIIERKAQDILLDQLNWNISIIKLPWRKELITVEW